MAVLKNEGRLCREAIKALAECESKEFPAEEVRLRREEVEAFQMHTESRYIRGLCSKALASFRRKAEGDRQIDGYAPNRRASR